MEESKFIGCFISYQPTKYSRIFKHNEKLSKRQGDLFRLYLWGNNGIDDTIKHIIPSNYGTDLELILFEFYIKPFSDMQHCFKKMSNYSPKGKSVGIKTIINDKNFFRKTKTERFNFLINVILDGVEHLKKKKNLDTNFDKLLADLKKSFDDWWANHDIDQEFIEPTHIAEKNILALYFRHFSKK